MTSSLDMIRGRSNVVTLTNSSGGALVAGDVCILNTGADESATTTTSANSVLKVYIAAESIAGAATGKFYSAGFCPLVTPSASVTRGRYLFTHTVAKQAAESATYGAGAFGVILKSGTTPSVWLFGSTAQGSGGGVGGSSGSTDNAIIRADGTGGATIQSSLATVDDNGKMNIPTGQTYDINGSPHTHASTSAYTQLGTATLGSDAATIAVSSIPAGYRAIEIIAWLRGTTVATSIWCNGLLNDDGAANYDLIQTTSDSNGILKTIQNGASSFSVGGIPAASATAGMFSQVRVFIAQYASASYKIVGIEVNGVWGTSSTTIAHNWDTCGWRSTAAITKVSFITAANFLAGSTMAVYGIT